MGRVTLACVSPALPEPRGGEVSKPELRPLWTPDAHANARAEKPPTRPQCEPEAPRAPGTCISCTWAALGRRLGSLGGRVALVWGLRRRPMGGVLGAWAVGRWHVRGSGLLCCPLRGQGRTKEESREGLAAVAPWPLFLVFVRSASKSKHPCTLWQLLHLQRRAPGQAFARLIVCSGRA